MLRFTHFLCVKFWYVKFSLRNPCVLSHVWWNFWTFACLNHKGDGQQILCTWSEYTKIALKGRLITYKQVNYEVIRCGCSICQWFLMNTLFRYGGEHGKYTVILTLVALATALGTSLGLSKPIVPWCTGNNVLCEELRNKHERLYNKFSTNITITVPTLTGLIVYKTHYKEFVWQSESLLSSSVPASSQA